MLSAKSFGKNSRFITKEAIYAKHLIEDAEKLKIPLQLYIEPKNGKPEYIILCPKTFYQDTLFLLKILAYNKEFTAIP